MPTTPRPIRVPDDVWQAAMAKAQAEGRTLSDVVVTYLRRYSGVRTPRTDGRPAANRARASKPSD